jgi:hypothetical protein
VRSGLVGRLRATARRLWRPGGIPVPVVTRGTRRRWQRAAPDDAVARLHLLYLRHRDELLPQAFTRFGRGAPPRHRAARAWRWYAGDVLVPSLRLLRRNGRVVRDAAGVPRHRQWWDMVRLSVSLPATPDSYYRYELYRPHQRRRAAAYLHGFENSPVLYQMLATAAGDDLAAASPLTDKVAFAERARARALPVAPTLAVVAGGQVRTWGELPAADLFVKPAAGKRGVDAHKWIYVAGRDGFRPAATADGAVVPRDEFLARLAARAAGVPLMVQPCLGNHPDLAELALDAMVTCRIVTMTDEAGQPEPVVATFRMPAVRGAVVDNMHRGGIAAPVALDCGALGAASGYAIAGPPTRYARHPVTGAAIEGRKLPQWPQVRELVCRAHDVFRPRLLVGWDVGIGPDGPVLLEGNERPGVGGLQRLHEMPLGSHRFGELLAHHLAARFGAPS